MSKRQVTEEQFLKDVAGHKMTILKDDGVYRHIRFEKPQSSDMFFDLITWPENLCYTGDMGTFVFSRLEDMFCFFRSSRQPREGRTLFVNLGYWAEKVEATDKPDGLREYDPDAYREAINDWLASEIEDEEDEEFIAALKEAVNDDLLSVSDDGEYAAQKAAHDFSFKHEDRCAVELVDFWEHTLTRYTGRFIWCCYALAWGISLYDTEKAKAL
jgi:hypothetical protein